MNLLIRNKNIIVNQKSFTLIEVLIGIVVVGILSSFIIVSISSFVDDANDTKRKKDLDSIATSLLAYKTLTGSYPIEPFDCNIGDEEDTCLDELIESGYATNFPIDPDGTRYTYTSDGTTYTIRASLSNNQTLTYNPDTGYSEYQGVAGLEGYDRRKPITVTSTASLTNYQMKFIVHRSPGTDLGPDVFVDSNCQEDYDDIRFTNSSNQTLDYWIESSDSSSATIWVEVDSLASGDTTLYLYYDNSSETTAVSNGENTFEFFDPCNSTSGWTGDTGTLSVVNDYLRVYDASTSASYVVYKNVGPWNSGDFILESRNLLVNWYNYDYANITARDIGNSAIFSLIIAYDEPSSGYRKSVAGAQTDFWDTNPTNYDRIWQLKVRTSDLKQDVAILNKDTRGVLGSASNLDWASGSPSSFDKISIGTSTVNKCDFRVYWILVRKYTPSEPTASWGSEESF